MQTFLPYRDFRRSARSLDLRRLGKQRVETLQILRALTFDDYGWSNHPAVTMWRTYTDALVTYGAVVTDEWRKAGFADTVLAQLLEFLSDGELRTQRELAAEGRLPAWIGRRSLHRSHQAALLRKDPEHYGPLFGDVDPELPYVWPDPEPALPSTDAISGWVVRVPDEAVETVLQQGVVGIAPAGDESPDIPIGTGARNTKRRRQVTAFFSEIDVGDRLVVPAGQALHIGEVRSGYEWSAAAPFGLHHARHVVWVTAVHRSDLRRPVHLQDPRIVFPLRGETILGD